MDNELHSKSPAYISGYAVGWLLGPDYMDTNPFKTGPSVADAISNPKFQQQEDWYDGRDAGMNDRRATNA